MRHIELVAFDFDGVFTDNKVIVNETGVESVSCWRSDGIGISMLKRSGVRPIIVSTERNNVVLIRAKKLKIEAYNGVANKLTFLTNYCSQNNYSLNQTAFVGNDINDLEVMKACSLSAAVEDAYKEVKEIADIQLTKPGGLGAVRELCDMLIQTKNNS